MTNLAQAEAVSKKETMCEEAKPASAKYQDITEFLDAIEEGIRDFVRTMIQAYAEDEFQRYVGARPYERTEERLDYRNGTVERALDTRFGMVKGIQIPRARRKGFLSTIMARFQRKEAKIAKIVSQMFTLGVSTRKVKKVTKLLWGSSVSHTEVSRMNQTVRNEMIAWLNRPITKKFGYLIIDGINLRIRRKVISREAMLCAVGITEAGEKEFLGFTQGGRESQAAWESTLIQLIRRGIDPGAVKLVISDGCPGMIGAIGCLFPDSDHQRCLFHKMGNLKAKCPKAEWHLVKAKLEKIYYAPNKMEACAQAEAFASEYRAVLPGLVQCLMKDLNSCLAHMDHPYRRWKHLRTTNLIERCFKEFRRRIYSMESFPTVESCIRIMFTLARLQNDNWEAKPIANF